MAEKRIKTYWLLLLVLLFTAGIISSVGVAQARYVNTVTTPAVVKSPVTGITSNCLVTATDAPRTVLLGQLEPEQPVLVPFWMLSSNADAKAEVNWGVTNADDAKYLSINVFAGHEQLKAEQELVLLEDIRLDMFLRLEMTEAAYTKPHEALKINVHVTYGDEMWGTFQVILPAVEAPETEPPVEEPVESTEAPTEETTTTPTEETTTTPTEETTATPTEETTATPTEETTTTPTGETTTTPTEETTTTPTEETTATPTEEPPTGPTVDLDNVPVQLNQIRMKTIPSFNPAAEQLPVMMQLPEAVTSVRLGIQMNYGDLQTFEPLPDYTMFSLDGGASYYMIFGDYVPEFALKNVTEVPLLLNFTYAKLDGMLNTVVPEVEEDEEPEEYEELTLAMEAYTGNRMRKRCTASTIPNVQKAGQAVVRPQNPQAAQTVTDPQEESLEQWPSLILTSDDKLEFYFPADWKDAKLNCSISFLTLTEEQKLEYVKVELSDNGLSAKHYLDENTNKLVLRLGQNIVQAGTYRIKITWSYENVCFYDVHTTFFVKNLAHAVSAPDSQEVPNDE